MSDVVDRANKEQQVWLNEQIRNSGIRASATDDTECIDCGEPIGAERKRAMPSAVRCIKCARAFEPPSHSPLVGRGRKGVKR